MTGESPFGNLLKQLRESRNLTHRELAKASGVSVGAISTLERGVSQRPRVDTIEMLANALALAGAERERFIAAGRGRTWTPTIPATTPHNLPRDLPTFIGRERAIAQVRDLLTDQRLVTLTGTAGCGKTRLALAAAEGLLGDFPDGVYFVDLAPLRDPALLAATIVTTLGVPEGDQRPAEERLITYLQEKSILLILDNFEHLLRAKTLLGLLCQRAPRVHLLVTSRRSLRLPNEMSFGVPPLDLPARGQVPEPQVIAVYEAIRLFTTRAQFARQGAPLPQETLPTVLALCRLLDGLPLAIELAAVRCAILEPADILDRLRDRFTLLIGGRRSGPRRHHTLRAAIEWSYALLDPSVQMLLNRLAVFAGGFTLRSAEEICDPEQTLGVAVLDGLQELVQQNLLRLTTDRGNERRFNLLETIREFALHHLSEDENHGQLSTRHAAHYLVLAQSVDPQIGWFEQVEALKPLDRERDNLRVALHWMLENQSAEQALEMCSALVWFWDIRGLWDEGRHSLERAVAIGTSAPIALRTKAMTRLGNLADTQGDFPAARTIHEASLKLSRSIDDTNRVANSLNSIGCSCWPMGDLDTARAAFSESFAIYTARQDQRGILMTTHNLGVVAMHEGKFSEAWDRINTSLQMLRELGHTRSVAECLALLAEIAIYQDDPPKVEASLDESLRIYHEFGEERGLASCRYVAGFLALKQGGYGTASASYADSLRGYRRLGDPYYSLPCLEGLAACFAIQGEFICATKIWGSAANMRRLRATPVLPAARTDYDKRIAAVRVALGDIAFDAAWAAGEAMPLDEAVAAAERWLTEQAMRDSPVLSSV